MAPSLGSVLVIFVLAPLAIAMVITAAVFLVASPTRRAAVEIDAQSQDENSAVPVERDLEIAGEGDSTQ